MKILHTADWHIGQLFHEYDRTYEHHSFLNWLVETLQNEKVDVLLISGDVFDLSNPSAASIKLFYTFLNSALKVNPDLQIIITAGNHDSASRLESPKPLLESSNIHIIGLVERYVDGNIDYDKLSIPLKGNDGEIKAWCLAIPFLRQGDYPLIPDAENSYASGVAALYAEAYEFISAKRQADQPIICMGHLHAQQAEVTDMDKPERLIMGGIECISADAFPDEILYVALGHIHKAQRIGGKEHIRYSGSPIPMSFSEQHYKHQVVIFDLIDQSIANIKTLEIPLVVPLLRIPSVPSALSEVLTALQQLPEISSNNQTIPYLEVQVLLDGPEPALKHKIKTAVEGKNVRLATIKSIYRGANTTNENNQIITQDKLEALKPQDVFAKAFEVRYNTVVPENMFKLFHQAAQQAIQTDNS
ncbi:MAG: exonuclease SbcCD subunit D C-terminal domain-containing protein [Sediminibacterium sp.]|nr:exonuclease SbcCD subunit D C-terminal domain-containing protein [Sediminibacterium sp.]